jgi:hypothetical protein
MISTAGEEEIPVGISFEARLQDCLKQAPREYSTCTPGKVYIFRSYPFLNFKAGCFLISGVTHYGCMVLSSAEIKR